MLESVATSDGTLCVDFFRDPEGGYGFEHFRSDPEDQGRWIAIGGLGTVRFRSPVEAAEAAAGRIAWLTTDGRAKRAWESWCAHIRSEESN